MRIAFDARWISTSNLEGVGGYALELFSELLKIDSSNNYLLFFESEDKLKFFKRGFRPERFKNVETELVDISLASPWGNVFSLPAFLRERNIDVYHVPYFAFTPVKSKFKIVATVHDLLPFIYPRYSVRDCPLLKFIFKNRWFAKRLMREADCFISSSSYSMDYINKNFGVGKDRMRLVHPGINEKFKPVAGGEELKRVRAQYGLPEDYILFMGEIGSHKNIKGLIEAYYMLDGALRDRHKLVIIGRGDALYQKDIDEIIKAGRRAPGDIIMPGYVHFEDKPAIYSLAKAFVYPTFYDGFPSYVLEAMACGAPVACSDIPLLNEFLGDSALRFDPRSHESINSALRKILTDDALRGDLTRRGFEQAKKFNWGTTARMVLDIYNNVAGREG